MKREEIKSRLTRTTVDGDWPKWEHLQSCRVVATRVVEAVETRLSQFHQCIIRAPEGRGKTCIARMIGYKRLLQGSPVWYVDCSEPAGDTIEQICTAFSELDHTAPVYILENMHDLDLKGREQVVSAARVSRKSSFLYTERRTDESLVDLMDLAKGGRDLKSSDIVVNLSPTTQIIQAIVETYRATFSSHQRLNLPTEAEYKLLLHLCGGNLRILSAYLEAWTEGSILTVDRGRMLHGVYQRRLARLRRPVRTTLVSLSAIGQFGSAVAINMFDSGECAELVAAGIIELKHVGLMPTVTFAHSSDAAMNVEAWAKENETTVNAVTLDVLRIYLTSTVPRNSYSLLTKIRANTEVWQQLLANETIRKIFLEGLESAYDIESAGNLAKMYSSLPPDGPLQTSFLALIRKRGAEYWASRVSEMGSVAAHRALVHLAQIDPQFREDIAARISPDRWQKIWLQSTLSQLTKLLWRYAKDPEVHEHTAQAARVLARLPGETDFAENCRHISYEKVGKLLKISQILARSAAQRIADVVASNIDVTSCNEPHRLTLILGEMWKAGNEDAYFRLVTRVVENVPIDKFDEEPGRAGLPYMLLSVAKTIGHGISSERAKAVLASILPHVGTHRLVHWKPLELNRFLWGALVIDKELTRKWSDPIGGALSRLCLETPAPLDEFFLLWNLTQINEELGIALSLKCFAKAADQQKRIIGPDTLPLIGLCAWLAEQTSSFEFPEIKKAAHHLMRDPDGTALVFAKRAYDLSGASHGRAFLSAVYRLLKLQGITHPGTFLTNHPVFSVRCMKLHILQHPNALIGK